MGGSHASGDDVSKENLRGFERVLCIRIGTHVIEHPPAMTLPHPNRNFDPLQFFRPPANSFPTHQKYFTPPPPWVGWGFWHTHSHMATRQKLVPPTLLSLESAVEYRVSSPHLWCRSPCGMLSFVNSFHTHDIMTFVSVPVLRILKQ